MRFYALLYHPSTLNCPHSLIHYIYTYIWQSLESVLDAKLFDLFIIIIFYLYTSLISYLFFTNSSVMFYFINPTVTANIQFDFFILLSSGFKNYSLF